MHAIGLLITDSLFYERTIPYFIAAIVIIIIDSLINRKLEPYKNRIIHCTFALLYVCVIVYITIFSRTPMSRKKFDFDVWASIRRTFVLIDGNVQYGSRDAVVELVLNTVMYIPFGFLLSGTFKKYSNIWLAIFIGLGVSLITEIIQFVMGFGTGELADVLNNTVGTGLGTILYWLSMSKKKKSSNN